VAVTDRVRRRVPRLLLSRQEAAEALGMSPSNFDRHVRDHVAVAYIGGLRLYPLSGLQAWIDEQAVPPGRRSA
jgi:hypothetical protein